MRVRINRSLKTKNKKKDDVSRQNTTEEPNTTTKNKMAPTKTEATIQIMFAATIVAACFLSFYIIHITALILIFKALTNFPKGRNNENQEAHHPPKNKRTAMYPRNWKKKRKKKRKYSWQHAKHTFKLILITLTAMNMTDNIAKHCSPDNPIHTLKRLLYSLALDPITINKQGSDVPIKTATMTTNRKRIRKDLMNMIKSITDLIDQTLKKIDNVINARNKDLRNITKMVLRVWSHLLGVHPNKRKPQTPWSTRTCGECNICVRTGPQSWCLFCNIELIGLINLIKINAELVATLPGDIIKSIAWTSIKRILLQTLDTVLILLIQHETVPLTPTGILIRMRSTIRRLIEHGPMATHDRRTVGETDGKEPGNKKRKKRKGRPKKRGNLIWHLRRKQKEADQIGSKKEPKRCKPNDNIPQYDGNDDLGPGEEPD